MIPTRLTAVCLLLAMAGCNRGSEPTGEAAAPEAAAPPPVETSEATTTAPAKAVAANAGATLYRTHCGMCHGPEGGGDGPLAGALNPKPRGFINEPWRFIDPKTPEETRTAIAGVIRRGLPDSGMPGYAASMNETQMLQIADHVIGLRTGG